MYKVFFNDRVIQIVGAGKITLTKPCYPVRAPESGKALAEWFAAFTKSADQCVALQAQDPEKYFAAVFAPFFLNVPAAGGLVMRNNKSMLFMERNGKWDLPKGKIDPGETPQMAALREVEEECGISGHSIVKQLPSTFHIYLSPYKKTLGQWILKETFWFEMNYSGVNSGIPQTEENITQLKWLAKDELNIVLENTYENLKTIIERYK